MASQSFNTVAKSMQRNLRWHGEDGELEMAFALEMSNSLEINEKQWKYTSNKLKYQWKSMEINRLDEKSMDMWKKKKWKRDRKSMGIIGNHEIPRPVGLDHTSQIFLGNPIQKVP